MDLFSVLTLIGGLAFFLFGMNIMSGSLEKMAGGKLEYSLRKVTSKPILSLILGAAITIAVQSSSATTVMLVGLVNSGIMTFKSTIYVIFGSNIGTTLTSWITGLAGIESSNIFLKLLKPQSFSPLVAFIGVILIMMSKKEKKKSIGTILVGFSILMTGMNLMSDAVKPLGSIPEFSDLLIKFSNPLVLLLISTVFTGIIQSSAASVGILQALSTTGLVTNGIAIPIVMGQNIGTCVTALISSIGTDRRAKRVAIAHVLFNVAGSIIFLVPYFIFEAFFDIKFLGEYTNSFYIAFLHTIFNIVTTFLLLPFAKKLVSIVEKLLPISETDSSEKENLVFLDERILQSPSIAISELNSISKRMSKLAQTIISNTEIQMEQFSEETKELILKQEDELDIYEDKLGTYLVKLSTCSISERDSRLIAKMLHTIGNFERLGDHAVNLSKTAEEMHLKKLSFSSLAQEEITVLKNAISEIIEITTEAYVKNDLALASRVEPLEQVIDGITDKIRFNHIERLQRGDCTIELGFILADLLSNYERISDHCSNIAVALIEAEVDSFDTHAYLNNIKHDNDEFKDEYNLYLTKYSI